MGHPVAGTSCVSPFRGLGCLPGTWGQLHQFPRRWERGVVYRCFYVRQLRSYVCCRPWSTVDAYWCVTLWHRCCSARVWEVQAHGGILSFGNVLLGNHLDGRCLLARVVHAAGDESFWGPRGAV